MVCGWPSCVSLKSFCVRLLTILPFLSRTVARTFTTFTSCVMVGVVVSWLNSDRLSSSTQTARAGRRAMTREGAGMIRVPSTVTLRLQRSCQKLVAEKFWNLSTRSDERLRLEFCAKPRLLLGIFVSGHDQSCRNVTSQFVILSGASAPLLFRRCFHGGRTRSRRICCSREVVRCMRKAGPSTRAEALGRDDNP